MIDVQTFKEFATPAVFVSVIIGSMLLCIIINNIAKFFQFPFSYIKAQKISIGPSPSIFAVKCEYCKEFIYNEDVCYDNITKFPYHSKCLNYFDERLDEQILVELNDPSKARNQSDVFKIKKDRNQEEYVSEVDKFLDNTINFSKVKSEPIEHDILLELGLDPRR